MHSIFSLLQHFGIANPTPGGSTGIQWYGNAGGNLTSVSPINNDILSTVLQPSLHDLEFMHGIMRNAYLQWRCTPAPKRGEIVRQIGQAFRTHKNELALMITYEMGKPINESLGEVQEMIDICDFAVGQSRMLYGIQTHSE